MDSARVFQKYLTAKIRAERINLLLPKHRNLLLNRLSYYRLNAGGRLSQTFAAFKPNLSAIKPRTSGKNCDCQKTTVSPPAVEPPKQQSRFKCRCKRPILVVPSRPPVVCEGSEPSEPSVHFEKSPSGTAKKNCKVEPTKSVVKKKIETVKVPKKEAKIEPKTAPCPSKAAEKPATVKHISFEPNVETCDCQEKSSCENCNQLPEITLLLTTLMKTLEDQVAAEIKQKEELNAINDQLKFLSGTVTNINDKCELLETEKEKLRLKSVESEENCKLCEKPSSICRFCKHKNLPILSSFHGELFRMMGKRLFTEVALTILLRADNVYHVNVRDLETGGVLGCLLVNDQGIREANCLGLFQEILTFCVIDVRSSMSNRDSILGGINFEFVSNQRLHGGSAKAKKHKELLQKLHNPILNLKADQNGADFTFLRKSKSEVLNSKLTVSEAMLEIGKISKSLIMSDEETHYPVHSVKIVSLSNSSLENSDGF